MQPSKSENEIFRHLRPLELTQRGEMVSQRNGGISFMCVQKEDSSMDFWIYICPFNAGFSAKAAVTRLRENRKIAAPWGTIIPDGSPLILQLVSEVGKSELPTNVTKMLIEIVQMNLQAEEKLEQLKPKSSLELYAKN